MKIKKVSKKTCFFNYFIYSKSNLFFNIINMTNQPSEKIDFSPNLACKNIRQIVKSPDFIRALEKILNLIEGDESFIEFSDKSKVLRIFQKMQKLWTSESKDFTDEQTRELENFLWNPNFIKKVEEFLELLKSQLKIKNVSLIWKYTEEEQEKVLSELAKWVRLIKSLTYEKLANATMKEVRRSLLFKLLNRLPKKETLETKVNFSIENNS